VNDRICISITIKSPNEIGPQKGTKGTKRKKNKTDRNRRSNYLVPYVPFCGPFCGLTQALLPVPELSEQA
jgi:hypothetical protein